MPDDLLPNILKEYWGFDNFLPLQHEAMQCVLGDRDSLVVIFGGLHGGFVSVTQRYWN